MISYIFCLPGGHYKIWVKYIGMIVQLVIDGGWLKGIIVNLATWLLSKMLMNMSLHVIELKRKQWKIVDFLCLYCVNDTIFYNR
jgi:hypothetical protein